MAEVTFEEIERNVTAFLHRVEAGETLTIVHTGKAVAEIKPVSFSASIRRPSGLCEGEFIVPNDIDLPLPDSILDAFEER